MQACDASATSDAFFPAAAAANPLQQTGWQQVICSLTVHVMRLQSLRYVTCRELHFDVTFTASSTLLDIREEHAWNE
jgi:hypothetical protein